MIRTLFAIALFAALTGCSDRRDDGPVEVSVIGAAPRIVNPSQKPLGTTDAVLVAATAQGLVRFDAAGQIEPALAIRWDVSDDGLYYTFRIADGQAVDAGDVARWLRAAIGRTSRNALKPVLGAIDEIIAVTPEVVEIRLHSPRPDLLVLLARPEMGLLVEGKGTGPFAIAEKRDGTLLLTPAASAAGDVPESELRRRDVLLRGERPALAVARFAADRSALVLGGGFADLALARAAEPPAAALRFDPVVGLFGLEVTDLDGFAGTAANRRALSMAIDRQRLVGAFGVRSWRPTATLLPPGTTGIVAPATPDWIDTGLAERRALARDAVAAWVTSEVALPRLRVALPDGPGSRLLFALLKADWATVGIEVTPVALSAPADLRLVDAVAPAGVAGWYLRRFTCGRSTVCSEEADTLLAAAQTATLEERPAIFAEADGRLTEIIPFIPLALPLRWSLVSPRLSAFQENPRGAHPLNHLREPR